MDNTNEGEYVDFTKDVPIVETVEAPQKEKKFDNGLSGLELDFPEMNFPDMEFFN